MKNVNINSELTNKNTEKDNDSSLTPKNNMRKENEKLIDALEEYQIWLSENNCRTELSRGMTWTNIDEQMAHAWRRSESIARELGLINLNIAFTKLQWENSKIYEKENFAELIILKAKSI